MLWLFENFQIMYALFILTAPGWVVALILFVLVWFLAVWHGVSVCQTRAGLR